MTDPNLHDIQKFGWHGVRAVQPILRAPQGHHGAHRSSRGKRSAGDQDARLCRQPRVDRDDEQEEPPNRGSLQRWAGELDSFSLQFTLGFPSNIFH